VGHARAENAQVVLIEKQRPLLVARYAMRLSRIIKERRIRLQIERLLVLRRCFGKPPERIRRHCTLVMIFGLTQLVSSGGYRCSDEQSYGDRLPHHSATLAQMVNFSLRLQSGNGRRTEERGRFANNGLGCVSRREFIPASARFSLRTVRSRSD